jgi:hypothetical protein
MDGDLQHPPEDIPRMLDRAALGDVDIVVASLRRGRHGRRPRRRDAHRGLADLDAAHEGDVPGSSTAAPTR